ncbi:hypothetical protein BH11PLA2_BH11PLA2_03760 [soil metagenome]
MIATLLLIMSAGPVSGDAVIKFKAGPSDIVVTTTNRLAGAVHSVTWNGEEFINSTDHGRQLQSASSFNLGKPGHWAEAYNPTEAGSRKDHIGPTSTSKVLSLKATATTLETKSQMAFWLKPGETSPDPKVPGGHPALNDKALSNHILTKKLTLNYKGLAHAMEYDVTFTVPKGELHTLAQFEAVTGYMPPKFSSFFTFDVKTHELAPLSDGPGEQKKPIVFSTPDGSHAMGILALDPAPEGMRGPNYGRWNFKAEKVVKWNCVYRLKNDDGVPAGDYHFRMAVVVGSQENVRVTLGQLLK